MFEIVCNSMVALPSMQFSVKIYFRMIQVISSSMIPNFSRVIVILQAYPSPLLLNI